MPRGHVLPEGSAIASLRGEAGLTQDQLAERAGYGLRTIGKIEGGHRTTAQTLAAIATVLGECLGRSISTADLLRTRQQNSGNKPPRRDAPLVVENIQWLELSTAEGQRASAAEGLQAVLTDTSCVRPVSGSAVEVNFYYVAASAIAEVTSLSHPQNAQWQANENVADHQLALEASDDCHLLRVAFSTGSDRRAIVQNRVVFASGDLLLEKKHYRTVVAYPTESLTLLVRFPDEQPYRTLRGLCRRQREGALEPASDQPIGISAGRLAYWRIAEPTAGATYQLDWS